VAVCVAAGVPRGELGKLAGEKRKEVAPRRGPESERLPGDTAGAGFLRRAKERGQLVPAIGDAGDDGSREQPDVEPRPGQARERAKPRVRGRGASLEPADQPAVERGEGDVDPHQVPFREPGEDVHVSRDERRLSDDAEMEPPERQQRLEQPAGDAIAPLRRLVGIGGGADDDGLVTDAFRVEGAREQGGALTLTRMSVSKGSGRGSDFPASPLPRLSTA
jgi:hypothetical protein